MLRPQEMVGFFPNGDWRTWVCCEFPGIDAGRFGGTSLSPAAITNAETRLHIFWPTLAFTWLCRF